MITNEESERIARITAYENMLDEAMALLKDDKCTTRLTELLTALEAYYTSPLWKQDFAADEAGLLPKNLKRGVLSEDGIYHLLTEGRNDDE